MCPPNRPAQGSRCCSTLVLSSRGNVTSISDICNLHLRSLHYRGLAVCVMRRRSGSWRSWGGRVGTDVEEIDLLPVHVDLRAQQPVRRPLNQLEQLGRPLNQSGGPSTRNKLGAPNPTPYTSWRRGRALLAALRQRNHPRRRLRSLPGPSGGHRRGRRRCSTHTHTHTWTKPASIIVHKHSLSLTHTHTWTKPALMKYMQSPISPARITSSPCHWSKSLMETLSHSLSVSLGRQPDAGSGGGSQGGAGRER